jgi:flagellar biosynthesis chaperone FliJ
MKHFSKIPLFAALLFIGDSVFAQTDGTIVTGINNHAQTRDASAVLEAFSDNQGFLTPRLTLVQRNAIASPATGLLIFQTDNTPGYYYNSGTPGSPVWERIMVSSGSLSGSGAATRVAFWSGATALSSNANLFWDNTNSRLGIGTASPGWRLDVAGNARIGDNAGQNTIAALAVSAGQGASTTFRDIDLHGNWSSGEGHAITASHATGLTNIVGQIVFQHDSPGSRIKFGRLYDSGDQTTYPMELVSSGSNAILRMNSDAYTYYGPNSTWGAYLQVGGNGRVTTSASVVTTNGNLHLDAANGGFATYINNYSANNTYINPGAGSVGVGNTTPAYKLDVTGDTRTTGDFFGDIHVDDTRSVNTAPNVYDNEVAFDFKDRSVVGVPGSGTYSGMMTIAPWGDDSGDASHQINFNEGGLFWRQGQPSAGAWSAWSQILTSSAGGGGTANYLARWINANTLGIGATYDDGTNVGIGQTSPGSPLHIGTTSWSANQLHFSSGWGAGGYHATIGSGYAGITASGIMLGAPHVPYRGGYGAKTRHASDQAASFYWDLGINAEAGGATDRFDLNRNNANLISVLNNGNMGIGTTAASRKLEVNGDIKLAYGYQIYLGENVSANGKIGVNFHTDADPNYWIGKPAGAWTQPLHVAFHTGIRIGAYVGYGGTRFYNNSDMVTQIMSVGDGDNHTRVNYNLYAPIMYDINDATYYVDPNGTSNTQYWTGRAKAGMGLTAKYTTPRWDYTSDVNYWTGAMGWGNTDLNTVATWGSGFFDSWASPANGPGTTSHYVGIQSFHYTAGENNAYGWQMVASTNTNRFHLRTAWPSWQPWVEMIHTGNLGGNSILNQWGGNQSANFHISGSGRAGADLRAPIFYDDNNTGYYADPNGVSNLAGITTSVNYNTFHTWTNLPNHTGFYSSNHNGAHFYPNNGSYGSWRMDGTRNGWGGLEFQGGAGNISVMIGQGGWGGMTTGMHANSYGWLWRFEHQTLYAAGMVDSDNTGYYIDPNSSTRITGDNWISDASGIARVGHNWGPNYCVGGYYCCSWDWWGSCNGNCYNSCQSTATYLKFSVYGGAESWGGWWGWSDGRFKEKVSTISNALSIVKNMRGVTYDWKEMPESYDEAIKSVKGKTYDAASAHDNSGHEGFRSQVGLIAQELKDVLPMAVMEVEDKDTTGSVIGSHLTVNYDNIIPVLIEAIKEQQQQIEELKMLVGASTSRGSAEKSNEAVFQAMRDKASTMSGDIQQKVEELIGMVKGGRELTPQMRLAINEFIVNGTVPKQ